MYSDLINRKALLERLEKIYGTDSIVDKIMLRFLKKLIRKQPTVDAVEVVRCKDCKFNVANMKNDPLDATDYSDITCSYFMTDGMEADDFCSLGEKMDGDKE